MAVLYAPELPDLEPVPCPQCGGDCGFEGYDGEASECPQCGGAGEIDVCPDCRQVPGVAHGVEVCGCSVLVLALEGEAA